MFMMAALMRRGYDYRGPIFNFGSRGPDLIPVDTSYLRETDLIFLCSRPPIDDAYVGVRRQFLCSFTTLEETLFQGSLRKWLARCSRTEIVLTDAAASIDPEIAQRQSLEFALNGGSLCTSIGSPHTRRFTSVEKAAALTVVFLVYQQHAWPGGPGLLCAFGMGGTDTLVWCYLLASKFAHLLCTTPFVMAEMRRGECPERPESMAFADSWEINILGTAPMSAHDAA